MRWVGSSSRPDAAATWVGFATFVSVMCGSSLTLVTNVADLCRYTPTRRDMRIGLVSAALLSAAATTFVGGYAAAASGETNPFVAVSELTSSELVLVVLLAAIVVQTLAANLTNVYTARALAREHRAAPGPLRATVLAAAAAIVLSAFPSFIEEAQRWVTHLGNVAAPHDRRRPRRLPGPASEGASTSTRCTTRRAATATCGA